MKRFAHAFPVLLFLGGCALQERIQSLSLAREDASAHLDAAHEAFRPTAPDSAARRQARHVARPWLAGASQPLSRDVTLPLALRANVRTTMMFADGELSLDEIAERLTEVTGIPVRVRPEAMLPAGAFMSRVQGDILQPGAGEADRVWLSGESAPLARILDRICARLGVWWKYEDQQILFYRTETRVFDLHALTLAASTEASLGLGSTQNQEGFSSHSRTQLASGQHDMAAVLKARIEPFLSRAGSVVLDTGAGMSAVVSDTPAVLRAVADYLARENRRMLRRVRIVFEELTLALNDDAEAGIDWSVVFSSAALSGSLLYQGTDAIGAGSLALDAAKGPFSGSGAVLRALSSLGHVVRRNSVPLLTLNRRPVTHAVRTTFSYIDRVETTALSDGIGMALPSVSVSQREETVGTLITLVPDAQDDGQILLSIAYDNTVAQPLRSVTFGSQSNPLQLQQITIDGNGTVQQVALRPGQPLLIAGFDRSQEEHASRRLQPDLPLALGGQERVSVQRLKTVMLVTAELEEGY